MIFIMLLLFFNMSFRKDEREKGMADAYVTIRPVRVAYTKKDCMAKRVLLQKMRFNLCLPSCISLQVGRTRGIKKGLRRKSKVEEDLDGMLIYIHDLTRRILITNLLQNDVL